MESGQEWCVDIIHVEIINQIVVPPISNTGGIKPHRRRTYFPLLMEKHIAPYIAACGSIVTFRDRKKTTVELCIVNLRVVVQCAFKLGCLLW
jgi:hypothetical protein